MRVLPQKSATLSLARPSTAKVHNQAALFLDKVSDQSQKLRQLAAGKSRSNAAIRGINSATGDPANQRSAGRVRGMTRPARRCLHKVRWHLPTVGRQLTHHLFDQPDIHRGRVAGVAAVVQFARERFARSQAAVHPEQLHQVNN